MITSNLLQSSLFLIVVLLLSKPLGIYVAHVFQGTSWIVRRLEPCERLFYRLCNIDPDKGMNWQTYAVSMLIFNGVGFFAVWCLQMVQQVLPLNPTDMAPVSPMSAFNTAISFVTNTNWQGYAGEETMSYLIQMLGLAVQNFMSAAAGIAVLVALIKGFAAKESHNVGNFWVVLVRSTVYILLPLSILLSVILVSQGVVQTFRSSQVVELMQPLQDEAGETITTQKLSVGPVASQLAIKQLGSNGGGFFNTGSSHPFENPTFLTNILEMMAIILIPAALCHTFGYMVKDKRQGRALLCTMLIILLPCLWVCMQAEQAGNPLFATLQVDQSPSAMQPGGNMEGKEARFGITSSVIWTTLTTATSNGSVNSMLDSYTPLGGLVPMALMQLGEVVFGGVGSGCYGMIAFVIIAVFVAGLMVGRTPEYLGKKIEAFEMKMATVIVLVPPALVLLGTALAVVTPSATMSVFNPGTHGFSEILYAFSSAANNNGSAFAGLDADTPFYNIALSFAMLLARYVVAIAILAIAGSLARKKIVPLSTGTLPTHTPLFVAFLVIIVVVVGALTFFPAMALGPVVEHLSATAS